MLDNNFGALINLNNIPLTPKVKKIINGNTDISLENILNGGDDYCLIVISKYQNRRIIENIAKKNKTKINLIGKIISKKGIHFDSYININNFKEFDHFS